MAAIGTALKKRSDLVAFYGVGEIFYRMRGFTESSISKNPKEYARQYIDEDGEQTDVVGYSPSISYNFDAYVGNEVHEDIINITDNENVGLDAVRTILIVDTTATGTVENSYKAIKREYAVIPDTEGDGTDAYTYSGTFKAKGTKEIVDVKTTDDFMTVTLATAGA